MLTILCHMPKYLSIIIIDPCPIVVCLCWIFDFRACLRGGGGSQIGEVTRLGGVTRLSVQSLILTLSRLHVRWGNPPHVTSPHLHVNRPLVARMFDNCDALQFYCSLVVMNLRF